MYSHLYFLSIKICNERMERNESFKKFIIYRSFCIFGAKLNFVKTLKRKNFVLFQKMRIKYYYKKYDTVVIESIQENFMKTVN